MGHMIQCRHAPKGCGKLLTKDELPAHLEKCPFERCKEQLANGRIDPIIKYFKKQIAERDTAIQDLRAQVSQNFKEEEESYGLEEAHISDFKDLVFKGTQAMKITAIFGEKYPSAEWSVFFHHVSESDLSYVYDGYLQWVYKGRRYILIQLNKPKDE
jgi:phage FluMu protein Com